MKNAKSPITKARDKLLTNLLSSQLKGWANPEIVKDVKELISQVGPIDVVERLAREYLAFVDASQDLTIHWTNFTLNLRFGLWIDDEEDTSRDLIVYPTNNEFDFHSYDDSTSVWMRKIEDVDVIESKKNSANNLKPNDLRFVRSKLRPMTEYCFVPVLTVKDGNIVIDEKDVGLGLHTVLQTILQKCGCKKPGYKNILFTTLGFDQQEDQIAELISVVWRELRAGGHRRLLGDWRVPENLNIDLAYSSPVALLYFLKNSIHDGEVLKATARSQDWGESIIDTIRYESPQMKKICSSAIDLAEKEKCILLAGERGVGCSTFARYVYNNSASAGLGFIKVNCATVPSDEFRELLNGRGSTIGYLEQAQGGALYFDRIDELAPESQAVLQEFLAERGKSHGNNQSTLKILSACPTLGNAVANGSFREDLYRDIRHNMIEIPPLCKRADELREILRVFEERDSSMNRKASLSWSTEVVGYLQKYIWPDNFHEAARVVRVLSNADIEREVAITDIREHLPEIADAIDYGEASAGEIPPNISKTWRTKYQEKFLTIRRSDRWEAFENEISQLASHLFTMITNTDGVTIGNFRSYLSTEIPSSDRTQEILVGRRVLIAFYHTRIITLNKDRWNSYLRKLGFVRLGEQEEDGNPSPDEGNFKDLMTDFGLKKGIIEKPWTTGGLWMEEIKWLERNSIHSK